MSPREGATLRRFALAGILVSLLTLAALFLYERQVHGASVRESLATLPLLAIAWALGLHLVAHVAWALRFAAVAAGVGSRFRLWSAFRLIVAGNFAAAITPARVGGEALRLWLLKHRADMPGHPARIVFADRALDLVFFLLAGLVAVTLLPLAIDGTLVPVFASVAVVLLGLALAALGTLLGAPALLRWVPDRVGAMVGRVAPSWGARAAERTARAGYEIRQGMRALLRERRSWLAFAALLTVATWTAEFAVLWVILEAFGLDVPFALVLLAGSVLTLLSMVVVVPGGSGAVELAVVAIFAPFGDVQPALVLAWRAVTYYYDVAIGALVAFSFVPPRQLGRIVAPPS